MYLSSGAGLYGTVDAQAGTDAIDGSGVHPVAVVAFMVVLAALDFSGTMLAKEWTIHRAPWQLIGGGAAFVALFVVLVCGLRYAEMSILTLGWIVMLQLAVIVVERSRYGTSLTTKGWLTMLAIMVLQGYLLLGNTSQPAPRGEPLSGTAVTQSRAASAAS